MPIIITFTTENGYQKFGKEIEELNRSNRTKNFLICILIFSFFISSIFYCNLFIDTKICLNILFFLRNPYIIFDTYFKLIFSSFFIEKYNLLVKYFFELLNLIIQ